MNEPKYHKDQSVTAEANKLVYGDRGDSYAHPLTDYEATAKIWSGILGKEVTPYQAALCMVGVKLSRASRNVGHRDSLVDGAGYFEVANEINLAEKDKKQPKVVAWDLAKPKCKFKEGDTVIVHDLPAPNQKYNGKVYKVMGDWGPDCVFVGDDTGERLVFLEGNLCKYDVPKFKVGDVVEFIKGMAPRIVPPVQKPIIIKEIRQSSYYDSAGNLIPSPMYMLDYDTCFFYWEKSLQKVSTPKFQIGDYVRLTPEAFKDCAPWVTKHGNTNRQVLEIRKGSRWFGKPEQYYYVVKADPCTAADRKSETEYLWEDWLVPSVSNTPKFKSGQSVRVTHDDGSKQFGWIQHPEPVSAYADQRYYEVHSCPLGGYVWWVAESSLEAA